MFNYRRVAARRLARIGFGATLICGAAALVLRSKVLPEWSAVDVMVRTWIGALAVGTLAWVWGRVRPIDGGRLFLASLVVPSIGVALMLPLLLHLVVFRFVFGYAIDGFDGWVRISMLLVGHVHLIVALLMAIRARELVNGAPQPLSVAAIYVLGVAFAMLPAGIPALVVAATGLVFIPLLRYQAAIVEREREVWPASRYFARATVV